MSYAFYPCIFPSCDFNVLDSAPPKCSHFHSHATCSQNRGNPAWLRLSVQDTKSRGPGPMARHLLKVSKEETLQPSGNLCHCSGTTQHSNAAWCSGGAPCAPVYAHCLFPWHWAPLKRTWLFLLILLVESVIPVLVSW